MYKNHTTRKHFRNNHNHDMAHDIEKIKAALADVTWGAKDRAAEMWTDSLDSMKEKSAELQGDVEHYVTKKPFKSLGIAVATGMFLGLILFRK